MLMIIRQTACESGEKKHTATQVQGLLLTRLLALSHRSPARTRAPSSHHHLYGSVGDTTIVCGAAARECNRVGVHFFCLLRGKSPHRVRIGIVKRGVYGVPAIDSIPLTDGKALHGEGTGEADGCFASPDVRLALPLIQSEAHWEAGRLIEKALDGPAEAAILVDAWIPRVVRVVTQGEEQVVPWQAVHGPIVRVGVCIRVVDNHVVVIEVIIGERVVGQDSHHRLHVRVETIGKTGIHGVVTSRQHDHPRKRVSVDELSLDPLAITVHLRHGRVLVVEPLGLDLQVLECQVNVGGKDLFVMPSTSHSVIPHLLL
mmetsp:Transcript_35984/g.95514  ORF Transcript_35984/g.95514 Transcript_35984/m.95514 type:complete len:315 (-) Transcript_35984:317-1261(-)